MNSFKKVFSVLFISLIFVLVGGVVVAENVYALSTTLTFSRNLTLGDYGMDVLTLQEFLNSDPDTQVALSGPGSPGQETQYFGSLTQNALIKYQNKYSSEVLAPVGLTYGTGYFGPSTMEHMNRRGVTQEDGEMDDDLINQILESFNQRQDATTQEVSTEADETETEAATATDKQEDGFKIHYVYPQVAEVGDELTIVADGLDSNPHVHFKKSGSEKIVTGEVKSGIMYVNVPSLGYGTYQIYLDDGSLLEAVEIRVVDEVDNPKISSVSFSGDAIGHDDTVTIRGERLSGENTVMTPLGQYTVYSNSSLGFSFKVERQLDEEAFSTFSGQTFKGYIRVKNYNGESNVKSVQFIYD